MKLIRKITVGPDLKEGMHYIIGQKVVRGEYTISEIVKTEGEEYQIWIKKGDEEVIWKTFNKNMPVSEEERLDY